MEVLFNPLVVIILILFAPFIALNAWVVVWICGPAIRRAGRWWEEGRQQAMESAWGREKVKEPWAPFGHIEQFTPPPVARPHEPPHAQQDPAADDAGHRWLGSTKDKAA